MRQDEAQRQASTLHPLCPCASVAKQFNGVHADFDLLPDGSGILALRSPEQSERMVMVRNLGVELRERLREVPQGR